MRGAYQALACSLLLAVAVSTAQAVTDEERVAANQQFRAAFDAGRFQEALPLAERVVALTEEQYGPDDRALANPLANLGTVQLKLGNLPASEQAYQRAVAILESKSTQTDRALLRPLQGLGVVYSTGDQPAAAVIALERAIDLSRNLDGLYNLEQLDFLKSLIMAYVREDRLTDAEKEHLYAFRVAETNYGKGDARMVEAYEYLGEWYEYVGRYLTARKQYARALDLARQVYGRTGLEAVEPLRAIARTYRLEYLYGAELVESPLNDPTQLLGNPGAPTQDVRLNPDGERVLAIALGLVAKAQPPQLLLQGATLTDLGDWYLTAKNVRQAQKVYGEAWKALESGGNTKLLDAPRQLRYKPAASTVGRFKGDNIEEYEQKIVEVRFTVKADGSISNARAVESDAPENYTKAVVNTVRKALYAPRVANGAVVDTDDVSLTERILVRKAEPPAAS